MIGLFNLLVFPGFLFLSVFALVAEFVDRKLYANFQHRMGPPWFQPLADLIKLVGKEDVVPKEANPKMFGIMPIFALASVVTAYFYIPIWGTKALYSFDADIIITLYLLTIPSLTLFLGGLYSSSLYARLGSARTLTQLFAYEVPIFISILSAALLADTWSLSGMVLFYSQHKLYLLFNMIGFAVSLIALLGKLEKVPFDIPEAETEIVAGSFTEYGGRSLAFFRLALDIQMVVGASLLAAVFLPSGFMNSPISEFVFYIVKVFIIIFAISLLRTIFARLRIDQMIRLCWRVLVPLGIFQLLIIVVVKNILFR